MLLSEWKMGTEENIFEPIYRLTCVEKLNRK